MGARTCQGARLLLKSLAPALAKELLYEPSPFELLHWTMATRYFTLDEANGHLPWLRQNLQERLALQQQLVQARQEQSQARRHSRRNGANSDDAVLTEKWEDLERLAQNLERLVQQVDDEGIIVRDLGRGLVDFPAVREGREVYLCWTVDEAEISYWHEMNDGYTGRQPLFRGPRRYL